MEAKRPTRAGGGLPGHATAKQGRSPPPPTDETTEREIADLKVQIAKLTDLAARAQADLQNAKARLEKQASELGTVMMADFLRKLLPTLDHFQRAFQHLPADLTGHEWVRGVTVIEQDLVQQLEGLGLRRMSSVGQHIDPHRHEVLLTAPGDPGKVIEVVEEGYEFRGKVLRPAKVKAGERGELPPTDPVPSPGPTPTSGTGEEAQG